MYLYLYVGRMKDDCNYGNILLKMEFDWHCMNKILWVISLGVIKLLYLDLDDVDIILTLYTKEKG